MKINRRLALAVSFCASTTTWALDFTSDPLKTEAIAPTKAMVEAVQFNNWLRENVHRMNQGQSKVAREHLHALVDSRIKEIYKKESVILKKEQDPLLPVLYSWASRLGVYGADNVYGAVRGSFPVVPPPGPTPPRGLHIDMRADQLVVTSMSGWSLIVPYYFFVFAMNVVDTPESRTEAIAIATGTASDIAPPGYSQATLLLIFERKANKDSFEATWLNRLDIAASEALMPIFPSSSRFLSRRAFDSVSRLHKEILFVHSSAGSYALAYSGLDGTYQVNRPHFLDALRMISLSE